MGTKGILIVDDEPIVRESLRDWLVYSGYDVTIAENGEAALKLCRKHDFGTLILDVRLPGQTGIRVLREIKKFRPQLKSIVITAYPTAELAEEARQLGAVDYLTKPVVPADLEKLVRQTLHNG